MFSAVAEIGVLRNVQPPRMSCLVRTFQGYSERTFRRLFRAIQRLARQCTHLLLRPGSSCVRFSCTPPFRTLPPIGLTLPIRQSAAIATQFYSISSLFFVSIRMPRPPIILGRTIHTPRQTVHIDFHHPQARASRSLPISADLLLRVRVFRTFRSVWSTFYL